jgi:poly-gamma-glutamate capsule biosynthesis protein CapA/YwtB (metallophosphatase superfamily)
MQDGGTVTVFLAGDVMTGRGVDQIMGRPSAPRLEEDYVKDARDYVTLAEEASGPVPRRVAPEWIWGDALQELNRLRPDARIVNLETSVTVSDEYWPDKLIHYRMHPDNIACLTAAGLDVCTLANNHTLDFGYTGLAETLRSLHRAGLKTTGAGRDLNDARKRATVELASGARILVVSVATPSSGVPQSWAATPTGPGVYLVPELSDRAAEEIAGHIVHDKRPGDLGIVSIHWGSNWGYEVPDAHRQFAHRLIELGVNVVHGHSSHHPRPIEVYRQGLILYGCGDLINDYEGITGHEFFGRDLAFLYFALLSAESGELVGLRMVPVRVRMMRLQRPSDRDARWLAQSMNRTCTAFSSRFKLESDMTLALERGH